MEAMLETAPSFSIYTQDKQDGIEPEKYHGSAEKELNSIKKLACEDFSFSMEEEEEIINEKLGIAEKVDPPSSPPIYLATGLDSREIMINNDDVSEEYCRELLDQYPNHPLVLSKYAQLLQEKDDHEGAAEYYFRAAKAGTGDGEVVAKYAQLVWEIHHDHDKALTYFDLAAQIAPDNSTVMGAYAKFIWETEDEGEEQSPHPDSNQENNAQSPTHEIEGNTADTESYYKRMIDENPSQPIFLKKYAQFLYQSKGDLQGAEECYSRAILVEPQDGEMLSQFGSLLWELYHKQDSTLSYLERAIEVAPQNSDVLAAYARILWSIHED